MYKNAKKMFADTIRDERRRSLLEFVDTLSPSTPSTKVWRRLQSMDGRRSWVCQITQCVRETRLLSLTSRKLKMKNGAAGPDGVAPEMIKHLPENSIMFLLRIFNESLRQGKVLDYWKRAVIEPILKNGKPPSEIKSFRTFSLPCLAKILESTIEAPVRHWAESIHLIPDC